MSFVEITVGHSAPPASVWSTILTGLTTALAAGIILFLLNWLREWLTAKWERHSEAEVLAFSLVTQLDRLISDCSDVVNDPLTEDRETGETEATVSTPSISFADDLPWTVFDKRLQYRIRALPNKIDAAARSCAHIGEYGEGPPYYNDYFDERELRFAWIGLEACLLTKELSDKYGVEILDRGEWEPEEDFRNRIDRIEKQRAIDKAAWRPPDWVLPKVPLDELERRRADLDRALDIAKAKVEARA
ncbi:hypothetical protein HR059_07625 [Sinorhizobium meliloti WSM1022]|uniref:hypothetical protein n=1 Tax=Rhizobium meliloti TaxID=382 RepID=UPI00041D75F5|nr:hypothetical protein [Sinorhizobium meliloti]QKN14339.1 hypothetical protein HR059_07625 [Sinorhizobium meliloti WSM1022]